MVHLQKIRIGFGPDPDAFVLDPDAHVLDPDVIYKSDSTLINIKQN